MLKNMVSRWFEERFDVQAVKEPLEYQLRKPLPRNIGWFHTFGSMSLFLFVSQVLTGILLLIYYRPTEGEAFESVKFIMTQPYAGWLFRQVHAWGANLMILMVTIHMMRTYVTGSYKKPRELTWLIGVGLFMMTLVFGFTGYLLPWNQLAYWATTVGTEIAGAVPGIGEFAKTLMRGGVNVGGETLSRFFVLHVIVLPWALFFLIGFHIFLVRFQEMSTLDAVGEEKKTKPEDGIPFFPDHLLKEGVVFFVLMGVLITLSILAPFELGEKANPLSTPVGIKPEWYFMPMYHALKYFPKVFGVLLLGMAPLFLFIWPFVDRGRNRHPLKRPVSMTLGIITFVVVIFLGTLGCLSESKQNFFGKVYEFDIYGVPHQVTEQKL